MIIAIDGCAGSGKGTLAKNLAAHFNFAHLDTGLLYRATAYKALVAKISLDDENALEHVAKSLDQDDLTPSELRAETTGDAASKVSVFPKVRAALLQYQQNFAHNPPDSKNGSILDGRDIGTVICPNADVKFFIWASAQERANRRINELASCGIDHDPKNILSDIEQRDARDMGRKEAPLKAADDAITIDTTDLTIEEVFQQAVLVIENKLQETSK